MKCHSLDVAGLLLPAKATATTRGQYVYSFEQFFTILFCVFNCDVFSSFACV